MKTRIIRTWALLIVLVCSYGCKTTAVFAPEGYLSKRGRLPEDVFGGYAIFKTDVAEYSGELIGMRNDSVVLIEKSLSKLPLSEIRDGKVIVCRPGNSEIAGLVMMIPNALLLIHSGTYPSAPVLALYLSVIDGLGMIAPIATESSMKNYFEWKEGWEKVMRYSRFPSGIPQSVDVRQLSIRPEVK